MKHQLKTTSPVSTRFSPLLAKRGEKHRQRCQPVKVSSPSALPLSGNSTSEGGGAITWLFHRVTSLPTRVGERTRAREGKGTGGERRRAVPRGNNKR
ncbi:hypothetical protein CDAR_411761 [Caerostris darwini]|uniref:Uncharacterized protein n=1 Tax=Caerostris darwini TaxID=1538125 RepID=A0AAV4MJ01_9ARAC|nr:hypothetical protein CDAR_411761 [Caerostris darwini]